MAKRQSERFPGLTVARAAQAARRQAEVARMEWSGDPHEDTIRFAQMMAQQLWEEIWHHVLCDVRASFETEFREVETARERCDRIERRLMDLERLVEESRADISRGLQRIERLEATLAALLPPRSASSPSSPAASSVPPPPLRAGNRFRGILDD